MRRKTTVTTTAITGIRASSRWQRYLVTGERREPSLWMAPAGVRVSAIREGYLSSHALNRRIRSVFGLKSFTLVRIARKPKRSP